MGEKVHLNAMAEYWEQTISLLQPPGHPDPLVKKPKLKPEYLQKPQFKFLVDVVNAVSFDVDF